MFMAFTAQMDVKPQNVGIIAPYRAHVSLLRSMVDKDIEVNTVDQYQGRDKDIMIYSCAKSLINNGDIKEVTDSNCVKIDKSKPNFISFLFEYRTWKCWETIGG